MRFHPVIRSCSLPIVIALISLINNENSGDNANDNNGDDSQESMCKVVETIIPQSNFFLLEYIE